MARKAIVAMINGSLYIDPSDATKEMIEKLQAKIDKSVKIVVAPIQSWMPESGTEALMNQAMKTIGNKPLQNALDEKREQRRLRSFLRKI